MALKMFFDSFSTALTLIFINIMPKKRIVINNHESEVGKVTTVDEFDGNVRKVYIENVKAKTNFLSITKNTRKGESFLPESRLDVGEKYVIYYRFGVNGEEVFQRRFNRLTKSVFTSTLFTETPKGKLVITDYNGEKNINFTIRKLE